MKNIILLYNYFLSCISVSCLLLFDLVASRLWKYTFIHCELGWRSLLNSVNIYSRLSARCLETTGSNYGEPNVVVETGQPRVSKQQSVLAEPPEDGPGLVEAPLWVGGASFTPENETFKLSGQTYWRERRGARSIKAAVKYFKEHFSKSRKGHQRLRLLGVFWLRSGAAGVGETTQNPRLPLIVLFSGGRLSGTLASHRLSRDVSLTWRSSEKGRSIRAKAAL